MRSCRKCGAATWSPHSPFCLQHRPSLEVRRPQARADRKSCGYGAVHKMQRERYGRLVRAGKATCVRCGLPIAPSASWHLDHSPDRSGWLGPAHSFCNLAAAAAVTNSRNGENSLGGVSVADERPRRWSRAWFEPVPADVVVGDDAARGADRDEAFRHIL